MRRALACLAIVVPLGGCRMDPPPAAARASTGIEAGAAGGQFFCRTDGGETRELVLHEFAVAATTRPGTVRSHVAIEMAGPPSQRVEAIIRLAVPRGAAVTSATLWVNGQPMSGAFVQRDRARDIYRSIVDRRRDPALVTWDGPGWVSVSIFPLERGEARRFEIEWIEPAATEGGLIRYRVPRVANGGRLIGWPSLRVDGRVVPVGGDART